MFYFQSVCVSLTISPARQLNEENTSIAPTTTRSVEILKIFQPPGVGNGVKLVWGRETAESNLNHTYGVHYGTDEENISGTFSLK